MKYVFETNFVDKPVCSKCMLSGSRGLDGNGETVMACYALGIRPKCPEEGKRADCPLLPVEEERMKNVKCPQCTGKGEYNLIQSFEGKEFPTPVKCTMCDGTGKVNKTVTYTGVRKS